MKKNSLGKGLESLIPKAEKTRTIINEIDIADIIPNPDQPRKVFNEEALSELTDSIRKNGIIQPMVLAKGGEEEGTYVIIAGERRWRAAGLQDYAVCLPLYVRLPKRQRSLSLL